MAIVQQSDIFKYFGDKAGLQLTQEEICDKLNGFIRTTQKNISQVTNRKTDGFDSLACDINTSSDFIYSKFFEEKTRKKTQDEINSMLFDIKTYVKAKALEFPGHEGRQGDTYESYVRRMLHEGLKNYIVEESEKKKATKQPNNVFLASRREIDKQSSLERFLEGATEIYLLNFAATTFLYGKVISPDDHHISARKLFIDLLEKRKTKFKIVLPKENSIAETDAAMYKMCEFYDQNELRNGSRDIIPTMRKNLLRFTCDYPDHVEAYFTESALPYALMIIQYEDKSRNNVKVDLYSPFLEADADRRSFIIYQKKDPENYRFFFKNFQAICKHCNSNPAEPQCRVPL